MTHAELLRNDADLATREDGMYYSGEYLSQIAATAESLELENAKLRELVQGLQYCAHEAYGMCARVPVGGKRPFTCCPLYDFDAKEYRCEKLMLDLGVEQWASS